MLGSQLNQEDIYIKFNIRFIASHNPINVHLQIILCTKLVLLQHIQTEETTKRNLTQAEKHQQLYIKVI